MDAAISTLIVSVFYLIPQMEGAGVLVEPLLGLPHYVGVIMVGTMLSGITHRSICINQPSVCIIQTKQKHRQMFFQTASVKVPNFTQGVF